MKTRFVSGKLLAVGCGLAVFLFGVQVSAAADWPGWRGLLRSGHTEEVGLPLTWDGKTKKNLLWKKPVDFGHSSPIIWGDKVFLTGSVRKMPKGSDQTAENHQHRIACYQASDGTKLWQSDIDPGSWDTQFSFTASTPITDGQRVYALFGSSAIAAVDFNGKLVWRKTLPGPFKAEWHSSSPILYKDTLFVFCDISNDHWLLALDKNTGAIKWERQHKQHDRAHNSSPLLVTVNGQPQLIVATAGAIMGLDPNADKVIWSCKWGVSRYPSVTNGPGQIYVAGDGGEAGAIDPTGTGDVSKTHVKWKHKSPQGFASPILVGDHLYRAVNPGVLKCWKWASGELVFEERLDGIPTFPSPVATKDGRLYFASAGKSYVLKAAPKPEVLAFNALDEGEKNEWTLSGPSPAIAEGRIFLRGPKTLTCIGVK